MRAGTRRCVQACRGHGQIVYDNGQGQKHHDCLPFLSLHGRCGSNCICRNSQLCPGRLRQNSSPEPYHPCRGRRLRQCLSPTWNGTSPAFFRFPFGRILFGTCLCASSLGEGVRRRHSCCDPTFPRFCRTSLALRVVLDGEQGIDYLTALIGAFLGGLESDMGKILAGKDPSS
jgi:hypothetical protein